MTIDYAVDMGRALQLGFRSAPAAWDPVALRNDADRLSHEDPSQLTVRRVSQFKLLLQLTLRGIGMPEYLTRRQVRALLLHEASHAYAARITGCRVVGFCVQLIKSPNGNRSFIPFVDYDATSIRDTPLLMAAIALHPKKPSDGDLRVAASLGYDVCAIVNARQVVDRPLPRPLSVNLRQGPPIAAGAIPSQQQQHRPAG